MCLAFNVGRAGATGSRTGLLSEALRVEKLLTQRRFRWTVRALYECVASMDDADERHCSELIGVSPWFCDAGEVSPCSRPRYYWLRNITVAEMTDVYFQGGGVHFSLGPQEVPELTAFLEPGVVKAVEDGGNFFCFLRPQARAAPPSHPAGVHRASPPALRRWKGDSYPVFSEEPCQGQVRDPPALGRGGLENASVQLRTFGLRWKNRGKKDGGGCERAAGWQYFQLHRRGPADAWGLEPSCGSASHQWHSLPLGGLARTGKPSDG